MGVVRLYNGASDISASRHTLHLVAFFSQAEDGIRDTSVTGVQTCALPISKAAPSWASRWQVGLVVSRERRLDGLHLAGGSPTTGRPSRRAIYGTACGCAPGGRGSQIGRASCRERGERWGGAAASEKQGERK